jgi:hypothetical protein
MRLVRHAVQPKRLYQDHLPLAETTRLDPEKGTRGALQQDPERVALFWETCQNLGLDPWETVWMDECGFDFRDFLLFVRLQREGRAIPYRGKARAWRECGYFM